MTPTGHLLPNLVQFTRVVRGLGVPVTPGATARLTEALDAVGLEQRADAKAAVRTVLACRKEHVPLVDRAFDLFFRERRTHDPVDLGEFLERVTERKKRPQTVTPAPPDAETDEDAELDATWLHINRAASHRELLGRKDFADLTEEEAEAIGRLLVEQPLVLPPRKTRRRIPSKNGRFLDPRRTLRQSLATGGEPIHLAFRRRKDKLRPLVVLLDVSGSMEPYARLLLQFAYTLTSATHRLEAFVFGTRLTRITRELTHRDVDRALKDAAARVVDWGGGTRIGESLRRFNVEWGRRVLGRGAVALLISDGWDRGDPELLAREMERLHGNVQRLIWLNPLLGREGYEPLTRGMQAALPHVDDFLPVHNLQSLEQLGEVLRDLRGAKGSFVASR